MDDTTMPRRGRNKKILLHQVGIRCCHCAHVSPLQRTKGAVYFPATTLGFYQAAQNMSATHLQCGLCSAMPDDIKMLFAQMLCTKTAGTSSNGGRSYWAQCAQSMGLVDTEQGVFSRHLIPDGVRLLQPGEHAFYKTVTP